MNCPNCGYDSYEEGTSCFRCGVSPHIGPGPESVDAEEEKPTCPKCKKVFPIFDNWECREDQGGCGYTIPEKKKKATGRLLTNKEATEIRKRLGIE